jgi:uncharacterized membrane protein
VRGFDIFHTILASVVCTLVLGVGGYLLVKGNFLARYFMISWSMLLVGALIYVLTILGFLPHNHLTGNAIQIGSVFEAILQSLGLAAKIAQLKKESLDRTRRSTCKSRNAPMHNWKTKCVNARMHWKA